MNKNYLNSPDNRWKTAIEILAKGSSYISKNETIIKWTSPDIPQPSEEDIQAKVVELKAKWDAQEYARSRQAEYPSVHELVVALYDESDKEALVAKRAAVKLKYPKP